MAHEEARIMSKNVDPSVDNLINEKLSVFDELADANHEIEDLKLRLAWLERTFD